MNGWTKERKEWWKKEKKKIDEVAKENPDVPKEIFDIEASPEMADIYREMTSRI